MTETNDLLRRIERGLNELPTKAMQDIQAYGKAEFERGHTEGNRAYKCGCLEIINENIELKDQNKELMRENVELRKAIEATHKGMITDIDRIIELQTEVDSLKARRWAETDRAYKEGYEKGGEKKPDDELEQLKQAVEDGCSQYEEIFKKKFGCHPFDYRFPCVSADEIFEAKEPVWYDAEKCLPLPDSKVIIEVEHCLISDKYIKKWRYADE